MMMTRWSPSLCALLLLGCAGAVEGEPFDGPGLASEPGEPSEPLDDGMGAPAHDEPVITTKADGAELYAAYCQVCHGESGAGSAIAPEIQHPKLDYAGWVARNGLTGAYDTAMVAFDDEQLGDAELDLILEYLTALPQPTSGEGWFLDYCGNCHGADGLGGPARKEIAGKGELLEDVRRGKGGTTSATGRTTCRVGPRTS